MFEATADHALSLLRSGSADGLAWSLYDTSAAYEVNPWSGYGSIHLAVYHNGSISAWRDRVLVVSADAPVPLPQPDRAEVFDAKDVCFVNIPVSCRTPELEDEVKIKLVLGCYQCHQMGMDARTMNPDIPSHHPTSAVRCAEEILGTPTLSPVESWLCLLAVGYFPLISASLITEVLPLRLPTVMDSSELLVRKGEEIVSDYTVSRWVVDSFWSMVAPVPEMPPPEIGPNRVNDTLWWYLRRAGLAFYSEAASRAGVAFPSVSWRPVSPNDLAVLEAKSTPGRETVANCLILLSGDYTAASSSASDAKSWAYCDLFAGDVRESEQLLNAVSSGVTLTEAETAALEGCLKDMFDCAHALQWALSECADAQRIRLDEPDFSHPLFIYDTDRSNAFFPPPVGFFSALELELSNTETLSSVVPVRAILDRMGHQVPDLGILDLATLVLIQEKGFGLLDLVPLSDLNAIMSARTDLVGEERGKWIDNQIAEIKATCSRMVPTMGLLFTMKSDLLILLALSRWKASVLSLVESYYDDPALCDSVPLDWYLRLNGQDTK